MELKSNENARQFWDTKTPLEAKVELTEVDANVEIQKQLWVFFQGGDSYYFVIDHRKTEYEFMSPGIRKVLGYGPGDINLKFLISLIHPEDQAFFIQFENRIVEFYQTLPTEKLDKYKVQFDYRLKTKSGNYKRILQQSSIYRDHTGQNIHRSIGVHTDITHIKPEGRPILSIIGADNEPSYINLEPAIEPNAAVSKFSKREKQILKLIVDGKRSEDISRMLYISLHTVNTHRKKILQKAKAKSPTELATRAIVEGWV
jgi:DNA-binding CsgD family transcriptional regulator